MWLAQVEMCIKKKYTPVSKDLVWKKGIVLLKY
jgi:hypothetical protein